MRLSTIKLSGFKSFVDPTTLHLPGNLTGVVGPNGCGKSNIIDAVRWVMGESSASRLRGDNLTDVIFAGSSARKPVSMATVELVFDNADGAVGGEFARFNEISVKRTVTRDSVSTYYLNGSRCRRRDITDLFLGTGLGPRSYSIIEQGTISQIIEARPEELRVYLEEAAGISKYKERRKETESRIRQTRENLDRLKDLREEVGKQLEHLKRQARQAEQYQQLKADQRDRQAQVHALEWKRLDAVLLGLRAALAQDETKLQALLADQRQAEAQIETGRADHAQASERMNAAQSAVYRVSGEIARIEQQIQHQREMAQRLAEAHKLAQQALDEVSELIAGDQAQWTQLRAAIAMAEPALAALQQQDAAQQELLRAAETALGDWQQRWDACAKAHAEASRAADVERTRIDYLDRQLLEAGKRRDRLGEERAGLDLSALVAALEATRSAHDGQRAQLDAQTAELELRKQALADLQVGERQQQAELAGVRQQLQAARGQLGSLETLQHAALGQESGGGRAWLKQQGLDSAARLGERLHVAGGWEVAVETVLARLLEAVMVDGIHAHLPALASLADGRIALMDASDGPLDAPATSLAMQVRGPLAARRMLARVHGVEDVAAAQALLPALAEGDAVVTRAGEWIGAGWARVLRSGEAQHGSLLREKQIQRLRIDIDALAQREAGFVEAQTSARARLLEAEQGREDAQRALYHAHRSVAELAGQLQGQQGKLDSAHARSRQLDAELAQLAQAMGKSHADASQARARLEQAVAGMGEHEAVRRQLESERREHALQLDAVRMAARDAREAAHRSALSLESQRARVVALEQALERMGGQRTQLQARLQDLAAQRAEGDAPVRAMDASRQASLEQRVLVEKDLAVARTALEEIDAHMRTLEHTRQQRDAQALAQREAIARRQMEEQMLAMQAGQHAQAIAEAQSDLDALIAALPPDANIEAAQQALSDLEARIRRLEPVNLAAIQEYGEQSERKQYLDAQNDDLTSALETLEAAIRKIDRETRGRFKDTFDRVNTGVQELYPRLFGGGHAYLELTGEDLLDTGVTLMARPPGKRVAHISLLSGGEKAMTAVALVFAIFQLNPAPFCLLDEVDAPLDEANVERFCNMVKEMSAKVQFLFVTHNKGTMQAAQQLSGVTMREPGVSRLVSVDLAEAARLAGVA
ncbi:MAG: chromosome segregation protein SMC [Proteobacteria bacterium]|nr:chromosome segregation protein SMC [Pseudomonadota bacterium]